MVRGGEAGGEGQFRKNRQEGEENERTRYKRNDLFFPPPTPSNTAMKPGVPVLEHTRVNERQTEIRHSGETRTTVHDAVDGAGEGRTGGGEDEGEGLEEVEVCEAGRERGKVSEEEREGGGKRRTDLV